MPARVSEWMGLYYAIAAHPKEGVDFIHVAEVVDRLTKYRQKMVRGMLADENHPGPGKLDQILFDICRLLELKPEEMETVLGTKLYARLKAEMHG